MDTLFAAMSNSPAISRAFSLSKSHPDAIIRTLASRRHTEFITLDELHMIMKVKLYGLWTSHHIKQSIAHNTDDEVRRKTAEAFVAIDTQGALTPLRSLASVDVGVASAILSWTSPGLWPVIDRRSISTLKKFGVLATQARISPSLYVTYVRIARLLGQQLGWTPQRVDLWLYACDKCDLGPEHFVA